MDRKESTQRRSSVVSFQKDAVQLGGVPGCTQVEDLGSFRNEVGEGWHLKGAGDTVMDVVRETDAKFGCRRRQRHEGVPGLGTFAGARPEAHIRLRTRARAPSSAGLLCRGISGCASTISRQLCLARVLAIRSSSAWEPVTVANSVANSSVNRIASSGVGCFRYANNWA